MDQTGVSEHRTGRGGRGFEGLSPDVQRIGFGLIKAHRTYEKME